MEREIYLIRHGETDYNKRGIVQGRGVDTSLNEVGKEQAAAFYRAYHHIPFESVYTSTLRRSQQTVAAFLQQGLPHKVHEGLDEICWGEYEGMESTPAMKRVYRNMMADWARGILDTKIPGGENPIELQQRQRQFLNDYLQTTEKLTLVCSHGRAMRSLLCTMLNVPLSKMSDFPHANLTLYRIRVQGYRFTLDLANNREHLIY